MEIHENDALETISTSPIPHRQAKGIADNRMLVENTNFGREIKKSSKEIKKSGREMKKSGIIKNSGRENTPPVCPDVPIDASFSFPVQKLPARTVPLEKLSQRSDPEIGSAVFSDSTVKVVARIRPLNSQEQKDDQIVLKISSRSLAIADRVFTFDAVADSRSTQDDIFQLVGAPLVKNSLSGFNSSILSYGQTGSGKTYTMWGPQSAMLEGHTPGSQQGIVPRVFELLFSEIQKEQDNANDKRINYQCRCSFLEIYNEQIADLLDPTQRNLQIKADTKNSSYIENLTEEYVTSIEDVTHILIKGLSNRKVGATSINSKSSRSHIVFTCAIESWCKGISSTYCSSSKTSRISFVDLAGSERQKPLDADREHIKENKNVKGSLSQLGNVVNILAGVAHSGKKKSIPYRDSCLTHLLQESLGGNAKLTVICAISPAQRYKHETLSTLRFGQRAKAIQNKAVVNEITEDAVNDLSDQIRQLKEELIRVKSNENSSTGSNAGYFKGRNARESLNLLRLSLNRSLILPHIDNDSEEEINVDEEDVREICAQLDNLRASCEDRLKEVSERIPDQECFEFPPHDESSNTEMDKDFEWKTEQYSSSLGKDTTNHEDKMSQGPEEEVPSNGDLRDIEKLQQVCQEPLKTVAENQPQVSSRSSETSVRCSLQITPCQISPNLQDPTLSASPRIDNNQRKSLTTSQIISESPGQESVNPKFNTEVLRSSLAQPVRNGEHIRSSLRSSKIFKGPTDALAASLHRGLQIIDHHQRNSVSRKSSVGFSFRDSTSKLVQAISKVDADVQTLPECEPSLGGQADFLCVTCKQLKIDGCKQTQDNSNLWLIPADDPKTIEGLKKLLPKEAEEALAVAIRREMELQNICAGQAAEIEQLNRLVEQYKQEREHSSIIGQRQEGKILRLEGFVDSAIPIEDFRNEEQRSLKDEHKILIHKYENHPAVLNANVQRTDLQKEVDHKYKSSFDLSERESLIKEIQILREQLQSHIDPCTDSDENQSSLLFQLAQLRKSGAVTRMADSPNQGNMDEEFERERRRWTETESEWISLTEELRLDLETNRRRVEKTERELRSEKECKEELDDALQRSILGHARIVEHYAELQEKHNNLLGRHRKIMEGIAEVKKAAAKAGAKKGGGSRFVESLAAELSALRVEREREREHLKQENRCLRIQLRDTAEAVHAAGELLVRFKEAEEAASIAEEGRERAKEEIEKLKRQMEKMKKRHAREISTMKQYLAESRLPESALKPLFRHDSSSADVETSSLPEDDQEWRGAFAPLYQEDNETSRNFGSQIRSKRENGGFWE